MSNIQQSVQFDEDSQFSFWHKLLAWGVHLFTASGVVWGFLAILAIYNEQWVFAFLWMASAITVDSFDGMLARRVQVKAVLPQFDGGLLDNMVDYFNYAIVSAVLLYQSGILPPRFAMASAILILLASAYQFSVVDAKTEDHYFKGFPSYWNIAVCYMVLMGLNPWINLALVILFVILVFVPIKYVYPSRTTHWRGLTLVLTIIWAIVSIMAIVQYPNLPRPWLIGAVALYIFYYAGLSLYSTLQKPS